MLMSKGFLSFYFILFLFCILLNSAQVSCKKSHGNPARDIVDIINKNRTALKLSALYDSPGLGCMALQYSEQCKDNCTSNNTVSCQPLEGDFTEVFAPDCGVELPTISTISFHIAGCWSKYLEPEEAFSEVLVRNNKSLTILGNKTLTEVGIGVASTHNGHFFWCALFSNAETKSSFLLEDRGLGIQQKQGCFSGTNTTCNEAHRVKGGITFYSIFGIFTSFVLHFFASNVDILL